MFYARDEEYLKYKFLEHEFNRLGVFLCVLINTLENVLDDCI